MLSGVWHACIMSQLSVRLSHRHTLDCRRFLVLLGPRMQALVPLLPLLLVALALALVMLRPLHSLARPWTD